MEKLAKELYEIHKSHWDMIDKIEQTGIELPENLKVDLIDIVLDILGVPKENSSEAIKDTDDYYCRDFYWDMCIEMNADDFIDYVKECVEEYKMERNNGSRT